MSSGKVRTHPSQNKTLATVGWPLDMLVTSLCALVSGVHDVEGHITDVEVARIQPVDACPGDFNHHDCLALPARPLRHRDGFWLSTPVYRL